MSFKRNDCQEYIEQNVGCFDKDRWGDYKSTFESWNIADANKLKRCAESDINSYFYKALISFSEALSDISARKFTWATVKIYYCIFYLLRADILLSNHLLVRCKELYYSKNITGNTFAKFQKSKLKGDHQLTIALVQHLYEQGEITDEILDNKLDGICPYLWLLKLRERVNYQQKDFSEPLSIDLYNHVDDKYFKRNKVQELLEFYDTQNYSICFDEDHSIIAIPYKKIIQIYIKGKRVLSKDSGYLRKIHFCMTLLSKCGVDKNFIITK